MAESDNESFILIDVNEQDGKKTVNQQVMFENAQLTQSILQANDNNNNNIAGSVHSIDQWSEVSAPSIKSINSVPTRQVVTESTLGFSVFSGTFLSSPMMPGMTTYDTAGSDKGYYMINSNGGTQSQEHDGPILSDSTAEINDNDNDNDNDNNNNNSNNLAPIGQQEVHSIGSVGTRVPFSWAEITKIQPQFHNDAVQKPKVFESTPKIQTRYRLKEKKNNNDNNNASNTNKVNYNDHNNESMPAIPESDPYATKSDLGRRVRRSGKRGSRLKYPNGRRGTRKNWRKKNQNK